MSAEWAVSVSVFSDEEAAVARAAEVLGRAAAGLALEGINTSLHVHRIDEEDES